MNPIDESCKFLKLKRPILESDLVDISYRFDRIAEHYTVDNAKDYLEILIHLVLSYLRGRGYRLGNKRGFEAHQLKLGWLASAVIWKIAEKGRAFYPTLDKLGFTNTESVIKLLYEVDNLSELVDFDVLSQAADIVRKRGF